MKPIFNITKFTALDYPDHLSAIIWFMGCNMRCAYCYNKEIVEGVGNYTFSDALKFLKTRVDLLDGVVLSGGEATNIKDLTFFAKEIKKLGFKIKLDTNGSNPQIINSLLQENLLNYIALDFKGDETSFEKITKLNAYDDFLRSLKILVKSNISYEVRTTYHSDLLDENKINTMIEVLKENNYTKPFYIQIAREEDSFEPLKKTKEIKKEKISQDITVIYR